MNENGLEVKEFALDPVLTDASTLLFVPKAVTDDVLFPKPKPLILDMAGALVTATLSKTDFVCGNDTLDCTLFIVGF